MQSKFLLFICGIAATLLGAASVSPFNADEPSCHFFVGGQKIPLQTSLQVVLGASKGSKQTKLFRSSWWGRLLGS